MSLLKNIGIGKTKLIEEWLDQNILPFNSPSYSYIIDDDSKINIEGSVILHSDLKEFPEHIQFGKVYGDFVISQCPNLISLRGCPEVVVGDFECIRCTSLKNLTGAPRIVYGTLGLSYIYNLESIKGAPEYVEKLNALRISSEIRDELWKRYQSQQVF